ncbi:MAG: hypothetical protein Q7S99_07050 [Parvibaculum sp.]|nr:hypothetical protein [Parvibaculum sp.]|tara:strand:- start:2314 stop:3057 length:744 start_codon:yes stop_codon:yes gene_type:complete
MTYSDHYETLKSNKRLNGMFSYNMVKYTLVVMSLVVPLLGIFREWYIARFGVETIFQDLRHISLDSEMCLGAWYSASIILLGACLLYLTSRLARHHGHSDVWYWRILAIVFVALSLDEETSVHEVFLEPVRDALGVSGVFYYAWVVPALILVPLFAAFYINFLRRLAKPYGFWFFISGAVFATGALGFEMLGGWAYLNYGPESLEVVVLFVIEESLEIFGMTSFIIALLSYLRHIYGQDAKHWMPLR